MLINNNFLNVNLFSENKKNTTLIFTHGLGEYSKSYEETANFFKGQGYYVITYDIRGHGKSEGERGTIDSYQTFVNDLKKLVEFAYSNTEKVYLIGHSMGGVITNIYASIYNDVNGVVIVASPTSYMKNIHSLRFIPSFIYQNKKIPINFNDSKLVHNNNYVVDSFDLSYFKLKLIDEVLIKGMKKLIKNYKKYITPILLIYSEKDLLAPKSYGERFFNIIKSEQKELVVFKESYHNMFNDLEKGEVWQTILNWLN